jgi:hypothetical protein
MRLVVLALTILTGAASCAQAKDMPGSGMDDAKCRSAWAMLSPNGDAIPKEKAAPYVFDFAMVDIDGSGTIDGNEFIAGCKNGLAQ